MKRELLTYDVCKNMGAYPLSSLGLQGRRLKKRVWLVKYEDHFALRLHRTNIMKIYSDRWEIYTGGWETVTTKKYLNEYSPVYIFSHKRIWYYHHKGDNSQNNNHVFEEGMSISK
jgi:hypothetical protein